MQRQQYSNFDLMAVFSDEAKAASAETKLPKEGFSEEEVFRLASDVIANGEFSRTWTEQGSRFSVLADDALASQPCRRRPVRGHLWIGTGSNYAGGALRLSYYPRVVRRSGRDCGWHHSGSYHRAVATRACARSYWTGYDEGQYSQ